MHDALHRRHDSLDHPLSAHGSTGGAQRALLVSFLVLAATAAAQAVVVVATGSVALLADTAHNLSDAFTAIPLWVAFSLGRRAATRRYTYGYGRAEDLAGALVVVLIAASAAFIGWESARRLLDPVEPDRIGWLAAAALIGFAGNEFVAQYRIRVGRRIGSAALVADGQHARADGLTSLAVLASAAGVWAGLPRADAVIGIVISLAIAHIAWETGRAMWERLMDAVEPGLVAAVEATAGGGPGVEKVQRLRVRWIGHHLTAELHLVVDEDMATHESHRLAEEARHTLFHAHPSLTDITVHIDPCGHGDVHRHALTSHHRVR
jgi:cation diffusion facilitator family transporter